MKKNVFLVLLLIGVSISLIANDVYAPVKFGERPVINLDKIPENAYEKGKIRLKFKESEISKIENGEVKLNNQGVIEFGITSVDLLNNEFKVSASLKVFGSPALENQYKERHRAWGFNRWFELKFDSKNDIKEMVKKYANLAEIEVAEPIYKKKLIGNVTTDMNGKQIKQNPISFKDVKSGKWSPDDPRYDEQWHYDNTGQQSGTVDSDIDLPEAWDIHKGTDNVIVCIQDGGITYNHEDISGNMWSGRGYNFVAGNSTIEPHDHGTHVAGTVAAVTNNSVGVSGIAGGSGSGDGIRLMSAQVFTASSSGGMELAPVYAADNNAAISQNSWGYTDVNVYDQAVLDAIDYFNANGGGTVLDGGLTIYAAGNAGTTGDWYPGCYSGAMAVAATDNNDVRSYYSNYDTWVEISAPGGYTGYTSDPKGVLSTVINGYDFYQGTSMACPHVSGVAALAISYAPGTMTALELRNLLKDNVDDISSLNPSYSGQLGTGRLNAYKVLSALNTGGPTCSITAPSNGTVVIIGDNVPIEVNASDPSKTVSFVEFFIDDIKIGEDSSSPYIYDWSTVGYSLTTHELKAVATDNDNNETVSSIVNVTITDGTSPVILYDQSQLPSFESARPAQDFEAPNDAYDCQGADDFTVPAGETWNISKIYAGGTTTGTTPQLIELVNIVIYDDDAGSIGAENVVINNVDAVPDSEPNLTITLPNVVILEAGTYWLSVQDATPYATAGQWFWSKQAAPTITYENYWTNTGGGFGVGAADWTAASVVWTDDLDYNLTFIIYGILPSDIDNNNLANSTTLEQNYPNPFNPVTTIKFFNKLSGSVKLSIYNVKGELVNSLINDKNANTGFRTVKFDASGLNSGVYYYKLETPEKTISKKMILVK